MATGDQDSQAQYSGGAFDPLLEGGRASGVLRLTDVEIQFESSKGSVSLPMDGLVLELGGAADRVLFFKHPHRPDTTLHTSDHSVLNHPILAGRPDLVAQVGAVHKKKRTGRLVLMSVIGILVAAIAVVVLAKDRIVYALASGIPTEWEVSLGDKMFEQLMLSRRQVKDAQLEQELAVITAPMVEGIKDSRYPLKFHIIEDPTLNAFAVPGGNVVIHSGLLLAADRPEEVAGVLAHEIAHVTQRHGFRSVIASLGLYQVLQAFIGDASGLLAVIAGNGAFLLDRKFSRDFERDADDKGWEYLMRANINPQGMIEFFRKMELEEQKALAKVPVEGAESALSIVSTHPATRERLEFLEGRWQKVETKTGFHRFELDYPRFKEQLRQQLHGAPQNSKEGTK